MARSIEADIVARGCPVGELIGSEAELMRTYQVGRGAIRQAVRILEDRQLVRPREGRSGGLQISVPDLEGVAASVRIFLLHGETRAEHLHDIWSVLVIGAVGDLARDITPTQAADLRTAWRHLAPGEAPKATTEWSPVALHTEILTSPGWAACAARPRRSPGGLAPAPRRR